MDVGEQKSASYNWSYDNVGRLTDEVINHWDNDFDQTERFTYDLTGNRMKLDRDHGNDGFDQTVTYLYDANDRLLEEILDDLVTNANDTTTTYTYDHTQQTGKQVRSMGILPMSSEPISSQHFTYNLQGRLSSVINEDYTDGTLSSRTRTTYEYDSKSYRVQIANGSGASLGSLNSETWTPTSETSFLADHHNHTGYTQTIRETTVNSDGTTKTFDYTFGNDEISQRTVIRNTSIVVTSDKTLVFGNDGHGSVTVLYDLSSTAVNAVQAIATYEAYGVLLATHNGSAGIHTSNFTLQTSLGYSGELWDAASQQQYLRARYYNPANGRFNRLDPFQGDMQDPQSLHKYAYVHGDPIGMIDPTGKFGVVGSLGAVSIGLQMHLSTLVQGAIITETLSTIGAAGAKFRNTGLELLASGNVELGLMLYELGGEIFGSAALTIETTTTGIELFSLGVATVGVLNGAKSLVSSGALQNIASALRSVRSNPRMIVSAVTNLGRRDGAILSEAGFDAYKKLAKAITRNERGEPVLIQVKRVSPSELPGGASAVYSVDPSVYRQYGKHVGVLKIKHDATVYEIMHEWQHMMHHMEVGSEFTSLNRAQREWVVYTRMRNSPGWSQLTELEREDAFNQAHRVFDDGSVGPDVPPGFHEIPGIQQ